MSHPLNHLPSSNRPAGLAPAWMVGVLALVLGLAYSVQLHNFDMVGEELTDYQVYMEQNADIAEAEGDIAIGNTRKKAAFATIMLVAGMLLARAVYFRRLRLGDTRWLVLALVCWAALSCAWSVLPPRTIRELLRLVVTIGLALGLVSNFTLRNCVRVVLGIAGASVLFAMLLEAANGVFTPWTATYRLTGGMHPNSIGLHAAILFVAAAALLTERPQHFWLWGWLLLGGLAVVLTKSRTALICASAGMLVCAANTYGLRRSIAVGSVLLSFAGGAMMLVGIASSDSAGKVSSVTAMGRTEKLGSLSGRVPLWEEVLQDISKKPLHGYGYKAYWTADKSLEIGKSIGWFPPEAHSAYLDLAVQVGLVGLGLFLLAAAVTAWRAWAWQTSDLGQRAARSFVLGLLVLAMIHGFTESTVSEARIAGLALAVVVLGVAQPLVAWVQPNSFPPAPRWPTEGALT